MAGRSSLVATAEQEAELRALSRSDVRGEADRARAILLTLRGWTSIEVAEAFGVTPEVVRHWRGWFGERGVDALRASLAPGPCQATSGTGQFRHGELDSHVKPSRCSRLCCFV